MTKFMGFHTESKSIMDWEHVENRTPKPPEDSKRCRCGRGVLVEMRSSDGKTTTIKCTHCKVGWFFPNYISNSFPWSHPDFKPVVVTPNPDFKFFRDVDLECEKDLDWEEVSEVEELKKSEVTNKEE